jgi:hypothetical protein
MRDPQFRAKPRHRHVAEALFVGVCLIACGGGDEDTTVSDADIEDTGLDAAGADAMIDVDPDAEGRDVVAPDDVEVAVDTTDLPDLPPLDPEGDSDNDGIPDSVEGTGDPDGDGMPNYLDTDSDGDFIADRVEGTVDSDGDGQPDYLDLDSDSDGINDFFETADDKDEDGIPNYLDNDSDNDGWNDTAEYGQLPNSGERPLDSDRDGAADFVDLDSDADGLGDDIETGCPESTNRLLADSDADGVPDSIEVAFDTDVGGQACDPDNDISDNVDFFFTLEFNGEDDSDELEFQTEVRNADVVFNMDTTGSMGGSINRLRSSLTTTLIPAFAAELENPGYAVTQFDDFPCNSHGSGADRPLILRQRVTTSARDAENGVDGLILHSGGDSPESGIEALFQIATGLGRTNRSMCLSTDASSQIVQPFDPAIGFIRGISDGVIGGVGFRQGAVPIVFHITDALTHAKGETASGSVPYRYGATRVESVNALSAIGARVIGVAASSTANVRQDLESISQATGSTVPACAWDLDRPTSCPAGQCCTGPSGAGVVPVSGTCPLVYTSASNGTGLDTSILSGIRALLSFATLNLTTRVRPDIETLEATGIDTSCFIESIIPTTAIPPEGACVSTPSIADLDRDGVDDGFTNVTPGSVLNFDVIARNDCVPGTDRPQVFEAYIDVVEQRGSAVYDTRLVTILVPPATKQ